MMSEASFISMYDVLVDPKVQVRVHGLYEPAIATYIALISAGTQLKPVSVFWDEETEKYILYNGFHRYEAHARLGKLTIYAEVAPGTYRDAMLNAGVEDLTHGLALSMHDKQNMLYRWIEFGDPRAKKSLVMLGGIFGVAPDTIKNWLAKQPQPQSTSQNSEVGDDPHKGKTQGADGKWRRKPQRKPKSEESEPKKSEVDLPLPVGVTMSHIDTGNGEYVPTTDKEAAWYWEGKIRRALHTITEGADNILEIRSIESIKKTNVDNRRAIVGVLVSAIVREVQLIEQITQSLKHDDMLDFEGMFKRIENATDALADTLQNQIREMGR